MDEIAKLSSYLDIDGYYVKLLVRGKEYTYLFEGEEQWNTFYYSYSYPSLYGRVIKYKLLNQIKGFLVKPEGS